MTHQITSYNFFHRLAALPYVEKIILFGSRARKDNSERSDIDLALVCPKATNEEWSYIKIHIIENRDTLLKVDCIRFDSLKDNDPFKHEILKDGVILYER